MKRATTDIASRALTKTERGYTQIEREAVGMHFGCMRFKLFLQGTHFKHFIDPLPLQRMMQNPKKVVPAHVERIRLKLQGFSSNIEMVKGKHNPADYLSRHPLPYHRCSSEEHGDFADIENHLFTISQMLPEAITVARVKQETVRDLTLESH
jgi:hypothetical protein